MRVGTLENPDACPPDIHIFTESKQPWVVLGDGKPVCEQYYRRSEMWPAESLARREGGDCAARARLSTTQPGIFPGTAPLARLAWGTRCRCFDWFHDFVASPSFLCGTRTECGKAGQFRADWLVSNP